MDRFGNYVIERELGRGGMGAVFAARHAILGHHVALKILHAELSQREDVVQRFFNEARAAAAIDHPGIVRVHDVGIAGQAAFLVMDLLAGESLAHRLKTNGPLPATVAVSIARQIAGALAAAHAVGIVHRDLKPDNIFLVDDPHAPYGMRVVLLDFGVAKLTGSLQSGDLKTKTGALLGTPHYMSPEQCDGEREIDLRSDLYSLGCMLYQMIVGRLPFEGGIGAVIGAHLYVPPPPLRQALPDAPAAIEAIVARLMAKEPGARFASAAQLVVALDAWSPAERDHAAPPAQLFEMSVGETLPLPRTSEQTIDSIPPPPSDREEKAARARPSIKPPDEDLPPSAGGAFPANQHDTVRDEPRRAPPPTGRRGVLVAGAAFGLVGIGVLVFALARRGGGDATPDAGVIAQAPDARAVVPATVDALDIDAAHELDAALEIAANRIDAPPPRDAALRQTATRDAAPDADRVAVVDAAPATTPEAMIQKRLAWIANAEGDWEASREFMILEVEAPRDPRLERAREDARKAIAKLARDDDRKAIHLALIDHDWKLGLAKCREWGDYPRVDIVVQCTVFACIGKDDAKLERWVGGIPSGTKMREYIARFCERYRKPD